MSKNLVATQINNLIHHIRGKAVMLDRDLAQLYQVTTKRLNEAVQRNRKRFPDDFMFQLTKEEHDNLRSQIATSSYGGRRYLPHAFTEQGVAMLSGVLTSDVAIEANIHIMRAFVQVKRLGMTILDIRRKIDSMEDKYDRQFKAVFEAIRQLLAPLPAPKKNIRIGFGPPKKPTDPTTTTNHQKQGSR